MNFKNISLIIKKIFEVKYSFKTPKKLDIVVFDNVGSKDLKNVLRNKEYFILETRTENLTKIYVSLNIIKEYFKNFKGNFKNAYLISLIKIMNPKVVLTFCDNSFKFFDIAKSMEKKVDFIAIQNGARYDFKIFKHKVKKKINNYDFTKNFFIPNFFCFGQFEIDDYRKNKIKVKNFFPVGSLNLSNFLNFKKKQKLNLKKKYDICLISDACIIGMAKNNGLRNCELGFVKMTKYTINFCIKKKLRFIFALARLGSLLDGELKFYKKHLTKNEYDYLLKNAVKRDDDKYSSYKAMMQSEVVVSKFTTMLREKLAIGGKILSCNMTPTNIYDFPIKGICSIKNCNYLKFEDKLNNVLNMSTTAYFSLLKNKRNYLMNYNSKISTIKMISDQINIFIKNKEMENAN